MDTNATEVQQKAGSSYEQQEENQGKVYQATPEEIAVAAEKKEKEPLKEGYENAKEISLGTSSYEHTTFRRPTATHGYKQASSLSHSQLSMPSYATRSPEAAIRSYASKMWGISKSSSSNSLEQLIELHDFYKDGVYAEKDGKRVYSEKGTPEQMAKLDELLVQRARGLVNGVEGLSKNDVASFDRFMEILPAKDIAQEHIKETLKRIRPVLESKALEGTKTQSEQKNEQKPEQKAEKKGWFKRLFSKSESKKEAATTVAVQPKAESKAEAKAEVKEAKSSWFSKAKEKWNKFKDWVKEDPYKPQIKKATLAKSDENKAPDQPWYKTFEFNREDKEGSIRQWCENAASKRLSKEEYNIAKNKLPDEYKDIAANISNWMRNNGNSVREWSSMPKTYMTELNNASRKYDEEREKFFKRDSTRGTLLGKPRRTNTASVVAFNGSVGNNRGLGDRR